MSEAVLGLSIGPHELRAVEVVRRRRTREVRVAAIEPLDSSETFGGLRMDGTLDVERILPALHRLLSGHGFAARRVVVGLDGTLALIRRTELPVVAKGPIRAAAALGVEELLSYPISDAIFDVVEMGRRVDGDLRWVDAIVVAVRATVIDQVHELCSAAGLQLDSIRLSPTALGAGTGALPTVEAPSPVAVVEVDEHSTDVAVFDQHGLAFSRTLAVGLGHSSTSVAAELEAHIQAITGQSAPRTESAPADDTHAGVAPVAEAVRRTLVHYETSFGEVAGLGRVWCTGERAGAPGLVEGLRTAISNGTRSVAVEMVPAPDDFPAPELWPALSGAYGLTFESDDRHFDLRLPAEQIREGRVRRLVAGSALGLVVGAAALHHGVGRWDELRGLRDQVAANEAAVAQIESRVVEHDDLANDLEALGLGYEQADALDVLRIDLPGVSRQIAASMPDDSYLLSLRLGRLRPGVVATEFGDGGATASFSMTGVTSDLEGVADWLEALDGTQPFTGVWLTQSAHGSLGAEEIDATLFVVDGGIAP